MNFDELVKLVSSNNSMQIRIDSRLVKPGDIFVAVKGFESDGHDFIEKAVKAGAKYVVSQKTAPSGDAQLIITDDTAVAAAVLAQAAKGNPASKLINLAVTGTNGKTTTAFLVREIIKNTGKNCGLIGTIVYDTGLETIEAPLTTPDSLALAELTAKMVKAGAGYMVTEASSHALAQNRLAAIDFKAAAFTNLTGDHLDYHKTEQQYLDAKSKLFEPLSINSTAVLNKQSPQGVLIARRTKARLLWFAVDEPADLTAHIDSIDINGTNFTLEYAGRKKKIHTPLIGKHNISNCLAAAGLCLAAGLDFESVCSGISAFKAVPGRLEKVPSKAPFAVLVDYAHTDDALKNVLSALKPLCKGKLIVVFGCGGDRDRTKRPRMARVAEQLADYIVVTSDNPRTEQPEIIIGEVMTGFENPSSKSITHELDRKQAIQMAISKAKENDIILIAGKGHENYQILGKTKIHFSDIEVAQQFLDERK